MVGFECYPMLAAVSRVAGGAADTTGRITRRHAHLVQCFVRNVEIDIRRKSAVTGIASLASIAAMPATASRTRRYLFVESLQPGCAVATLSAVSAVTTIAAVTARARLRKQMQPAAELSHSDLRQFAHPAIPALCAILAVTAMTAGASVQPVG